MYIKQITPNFLYAVIRNCDNKNLRRTNKTQPQLMSLSLLYQICSLMESLRYFYCQTETRHTHPIKYRNFVCNPISRIRKNHFSLTLPEWGYTCVVCVWTVFLKYIKVTRPRNTDWIKYAKFHVRHPHPFTEKDRTALFGAHPNAHTHTHIARRRRRL